MRTAAELAAHVPQVGRLIWIGVRPERAAPMHALDTVELVADRGLAGDRAGRRAGGKRQVSLIQAEHLAVIAALMRADRIDPALLRRNLVVEGAPLRALARARFRVGDALLEGTGECHPCSKMEAALGDGGYAATRGHGGILARILEGARVTLGDPVRADL